MFLLSLLLAGPISKFEAKPPIETIESRRALEDVERCLIDMDGLLAPMVYRQPDLPDSATLIWKSPQGLSVARVDVRRSAVGTTIVSWFAAKQVRGCAEG